MLEVCKCGSNRCETEWRAVIFSGLLKVPGIASGSGWRILKTVVHRMNEGYEAWGTRKRVLINRGFWDKCEEVSI